MPVNRQTVRELSRTTLYNITSSGQAWRAFLDAAARLYKYSFPEQVLIYAQEPEATASRMSSLTGIGVSSKLMDFPYSRRVNRLVHWCC